MTEDRVIHSGKALEILLDLAQMFGAVSLFDAAFQVGKIASDLPGLYFGVALMWSFFAISILHTVGATLEVFEAEYQKNWAVLGLNWIANFNGLLLFVSCTPSVRESSFPWLSMVTPLIQTIVLVYALNKMEGCPRHIRMVLMALDVLLAVGIAVAVHAESLVVTLCSDISLVKSLSSGIPFAAYIPDDCFDFGQMFDSIISTWSVAGEQLFFARLNCTKGVCTTPTTIIDPSVMLLLSNVDLAGYWMNGIGIAAITLAAMSVVVLGGSFVKLIVESHSTDSTKPGRALKVLVVCGWVVVYPIYESCRLVVRLFDWLKSLNTSLKEGKYEFRPDGRILLSDEQ